MAVVVVVIVVVVGGGGGGGGERKTRRDAPEVATRLMRSHAPTASARARPSHRLHYISLCACIVSYCTYQEGSRRFINTFQQGFE